MKKVIFKFALLAIVTMGSISIMSCKKGDENIDNKPEAGNIINGHEYVDLGLPSGLKWATCNIGSPAFWFFSLYVHFVCINFKKSIFTFLIGLYPTINC